MKIYSTIQRGFEHKIYCEDAAEFWQPAPGLVVALVSDGCSGGCNSHFASALTAKIIAKIVTTLQPQVVVSASEAGKFILKTFLKELCNAKKILGLLPHEILATLVIAVVYENNVWIAALGDGVIVLDDAITELNQQNLPDYPAYHLHESEAEQEKYLFKQVFEKQDFTGISIATDGILSYTDARQPLVSHNNLVLPWLLTDTHFHETKSMLSRKCNLLNSKHSLLPADDVSIIRIINPKNN